MVPNKGSLHQAWAAWNLETVSMPINCCDIFWYSVHRAFVYTVYSALLWQKEASDKSDISCKRAKCVRHFHWRQWNIMSYRTYLLAGWVFIHKIWPGRRAHWVKYRNINNSDLDGMSLASFCQSRAVLYFNTEGTAQVLCQTPLCCPGGIWFQQTAINIHELSLYP